MATEPDAGDTANDEPELSDEHTRIVEVPLAEADVDRIEFELEHREQKEFSPTTVEEFIEHALHLRFSGIDSRADRVRSTPEVEVPPELARRAELRVASQRQRGKETHLEEALLNEVGFYPTYTVDGEPIEDRSDTDH